MQTQVEKGNGHKGLALPPGFDPSAYADSETVVLVTIEGKSPMLQHAMTEDTVVNVLIRGERPQKDKTAKLEDIAKLGLYLGPKGEFGIKSDCLFACLREAGRMVKFDGRKSISTATSTMLPSFLTIEPPIDEGDGFIPFVGEAKWVHVVHRGNLKNAGKETAVGIVRPRFDKWALQTRVVISPEGGITEETVKTLISVAGRRVGLGAFRPQKNGQFGRFTLTGWEVLKARTVEASTATPTGDGEEEGEGTSDTE